VDPVTLAAVTTRLLVPYLAALIAKLPMEQPITVTGATVAPAGTVQNLWDVLKQPNAKSGEIIEIASELAKNPTDSDAEGALRRQLRLLFAQEPAVAKEVEGVLVAAEPKSTGGTVVGEVAMGNVVIGGYITSGEWNVSQSSREK